MRVELRRLGAHRLNLSGVFPFGLRIPPELTREGAVAAFGRKVAAGTEGPERLAALIQNNSDLSQGPATGSVIRLRMRRTDYEGEALEQAYDGANSSSCSAAVQRPRGRSWPARSSRSSSSAGFEHLVGAFRQGLREAGFVEGRNCAIEYRWADNEFDRLPALVADLLRSPISVIVTNTPGALAATVTATTVPIVFVTGADPVRAGLVASLHLPGGNVTGISFLAPELGAKHLGFLREVRPRAARIAVVDDPRFPTTERFVSEVRAAASVMGQQIEVLYASSDREIEVAFTTLVQRGAHALLAGSGGFLYSHRERVVALAARHRIPAIYISRDYVEAAGLMRAKSPMWARPLPSPTRSTTPPACACASLRSGSKSCWSKAAYPGGLP